MYFTIDQQQWIRNELVNNEDERKISESLISYMQQHQLYKLIVPKEFGGSALPLPTVIRTFQEASYIDGTFGWLVTIGTGGGMFVPNFTEQAARIFYSPEHAVIAGSGYPSGVAEKIENGYVISGEWHYCSGSQYASIFTVTCKLAAGDGILSFILEPEQVEVIEDWDAFGLKATSSNTIRVTDQFVPEERAFSIFQTKHDIATPVHRFPFLMFSEASFGAVMFGISKHLLDESRTVITGSNGKWHDARYTFALSQLEQEEKRYAKAEQIFYDALTTTWEQHVNGETLSSSHQQKFSVMSKKCASTLLSSAHTLIRLVGMQGIMQSSMINRIYCDLQTASLHMFLTPSSVAEMQPYDVLK